MFGNRPAAFLALGLAMLASSCVTSTEVKTYAQGEKAQVGFVTYNVFEAQWLPQLGDGLMARVPTDRYFQVRISVSNGGASEFLIPPLNLVDDNGKLITELSDGTGVPHWLGASRKVNSAETADGVILFDAPARHYKLQVESDTGVQAFIDLPLRFGSDTQKQDVIRMPQ
ncbi:MAG: hypothetical protein EXQ52_16685 [Bryobacterales bacterium]|nr:hypothetical protein [Bryobacterales bacterium]